jgi:hypothetical protein
LLRRIFGPKRAEVTEVRENCIMRSFITWYSSPSIIRMMTSRKMRWTGHVERMGRRGRYAGYWWPGGKRPVGRLRRRWLNTIKMNLKEIGWGGVDLIDLAQNRE